MCSILCMFAKYRTDVRGKHLQFTVNSPFVINLVTLTAIKVIVKVYDNNKCY